MILNWLVAVFAGIICGVIALGAIVAAMEIRWRAVVRDSNEGTERAVSPESADTEERAARQGTGP
jgi:hypothetical protein